MRRPEEANRPFVFLETIVVLCVLLVHSLHTVCTVTMGSPLESAIHLLLLAYLTAMPILSCQKQRNVPAEAKDVCI